MSLRILSLDLPPKPMRVLEALKILEDATLECKKRPINTPEVKEALDVMERNIDTESRVVCFRHNLDRHPGSFRFSSNDSEGQQQNLRAHILGIHRCVRAALSKDIGVLGRIYLQSNKDPAIKVEIDRLNDELAKMPARWVFRAR